MAAPYRGTFAARMASITSAASNTTNNNVESWDTDFDDDLLFKNSTTQSLSSRMSVRSESNTGDDDWHVLITPNDESSTTRAITTAARESGIPIGNVAPSALLGGTIKRLGKKKSSRKIEVEDDFGMDFDLPGDASAGLQLKAPMQMPHTPDFDDCGTDWGEGSLGIRFAGTRNARGARSSSVSAMSPSLGSCMTVESEEDDLLGLVLPNEPLDFSSRLEKLKRTEQLPTPDASPLPPQHLRDPPPTSAPALSPLDVSPPPAVTAPSPPLESQATPSPKPKPVDDEEDFLDGLDFGGDEIFDSQKLTLNRNVVVKKPAAKPSPPSAARPASTITFSDRPTTSRIPRPLPSSNRTRLTPVYETGASTQGQSRPMPTTTSAQLLRAKRSAPVLRNSNINQTSRTPFLPAGNSTSQSHHVMAKSSQPHLRRDSDPRRPQSPSMRSYSRLSGHQNETPSRAGVRRDLAPSALARHPPPKKLTQPQRKRNFGDGHELDLFDDLPTSATKEKQFEKVPRNVASNRTLRQQPSNSRLPMPDRMATPQPQTPRSPPKPDHTPRFARDTAASRNAREQRLAGTRSRADGPIAPRPISWAAQVMARSPHTSPSAHRKKATGQKPQLIRQMTQPFSHNEKGMVYNPTMQRWEGNEEALVSFSHPNTSTTTLALTTASTPTFAPPGHPLSRPHERSQSISHTALSNIHAAQKSFSSRAAKLAAAPAPVPVPSPPRPALISQISVPRGVQYEGRMVFDPVKMTWLKAARPSNDPRSPSELDEEDDDPFAGLDDLKDNESVAGSNAAGGAGTPNPDEPSFVGEEFDVGPGFIRRQRDEEAIWRRRVEGWVGGLRDNGDQRGGWRWAIRDFAASASAGASAI
ncbi:Nn.00g074590.m01.CDS01 [Neocucurbitaria sp. VM-36]